MLYFKNQKDVAERLKVLIDGYWEMEVKEDDLIESIKSIIKNNGELIYKDNDYTKILEQRLGLKRLNLIDKILADN